MITINTGLNTTTKHFILQSSGFLNHLSLCTSVAPDMPPHSVSILDVRDTSISISWEPVQCLHQNSEIVGYLVAFGRTASYQDNQQRSEVLTSYRLSMQNLQPNESYAFQVYPVTVDGPNVETGTGIVSVKTQVSWNHLYTTQYD